MIYLALALCLAGLLCIWFGAEPYMLFGQAWLLVLGAILLVAAVWVGC